jgi:hypothetical protein
MGAKNEISMTSKKEFTLPKGAKIISKECRISVEEIENGFLLRKSYDIRYSLEGDTNYEYFTKVWFSEENPIEIKEIKNTKSIAFDLE